MSEVAVNLPAAVWAMLTDVWPAKREDFDAFAARHRVALGEVGVQSEPVGADGEVGGHLLAGADEAQVWFRLSAGALVSIYIFAYPSPQPAYEGARRGLRALQDYLDDQARDSTGPRIRAATPSAEWSATFPGVHGWAIPGFRSIEIQLFDRRDSVVMISIDEF